MKAPQRPFRCQERNGAVHLRDTHPEAIMPSAPLAVGYGPMTMGLLTSLGMDGEMGSLKTLHALVGGAWFWNPETLAQARPEAVEAYLEEVVGERNPRRLNELRGIRELSANERILEAKRIIKGAKVDTEVRRALAYAAGLPLEAVNGVRQDEKGIGISLDRSEITWLPEGLVLSHNIDLTDCPNLRRVPPIRPQMSMILGRCAGLVELPPDLEVGGVLNLQGCVSLEALPQGLHVRGALDIRGLAGIKSLPSRLVVESGLLMDRSGIVEIPSDSEIHGVLYANRCMDLQRILCPLFVEKAHLGGCSALENLDEVDVDGIDIQGCHRIQLPQITTVRSSFFIRDTPFALLSDGELRSMFPLLSPSASIVR